MLSGDIVGAYLCGRPVTSRNIWFPYLAPARGARSKSPYGVTRVTVVRVWQRSRDVVRD